MRPTSPSSPSTRPLALQEGMEGVCPFANLSCNGAIKAPPKELLCRGAAHQGGDLKRGDRVMGCVRQAWLARTGDRLRIDFP